MNAHCTHGPKTVGAPSRGSVQHPSGPPAVYASRGPSPRWKTGPGLSVSQGVPNPQGGGTRRGPRPGSPAGDPNRRVPSSFRAVRPQKVTQAPPSPRAATRLTPRLAQPRVQARSFWCASRPDPQNPLVSSPRKTTGDTSPFLFRKEGLQSAVGKVRSERPESGSLQGRWYEDRSSRLTTAGRRTPRLISARVRPKQTRGTA